MLNDFYQSLNPIAFSFGPIAVRWYGLAYIAGFICVALLMYHLGKRWKLDFSTDDLLTVITCLMIGVIVGARVGYCLLYGAGFYLFHPLQILMVNQGGMSFHGGLAGALLSATFSSKFTKMPFLTLADMGAIAAPIGLFFGRCANFINGELWGAVTDLPWGVVFGGAAGTMPRHPSQLYEALLEGVLLFIVLFALSRKRPPYPRGTFIAIFLILYGIFRILLEFVRQPDVQIGYLAGGWLTMGQVLSVPLVIAGLCLLIWARKTKLTQGEK